MLKDISLADGHSIPILGLGTWQLRGKACTAAVEAALEIGYRHIDTAVLYENHQAIAPALRQVPRSDLFITSKIPSDALEYESVLVQTERALDELRCEYLDLLLIHWPNAAVPLDETLRAFSRLRDEGKIRSIGVSNFTVTRLKEALTFADLPIVTNQVEFHPFLHQRELLSFCEQAKVVLTAYSPLARGKVLEDAELLRTAKRHQATAAQVALRWAMQKGIVVIPKATSRERLQENFDSLKLSLHHEEMQQIDALHRDQRLVAPDWADFTES
ncbi:MAG: aldo/keto reductase [Bdellovibrionales bacterium]|nr:aldo/keto reductase [Bdellovibrionales bacterium]